jgi:hypothetical protein
MQKGREREYGCVSERERERERKSELGRMKVSRRRERRKAMSGCQLVQVGQKNKEEKNGGATRCLKKKGRRTCSLSARKDNKIVAHTPGWYLMIA